MRWQIISPRPEPWSGPLVVKNGSKICSRCSLGDARARGRVTSMQRPISGARRRTRCATRTLAALGRGRLDRVQQQVQQHLVEADRAPPSTFGVSESRSTSSVTLPCVASGWSSRDDLVARARRDPSASTRRGRLAGAAEAAHRLDEPPDALDLARRELVIVRPRTRVVLVALARRHARGRCGSRPAGC